MTREEYIEERHQLEMRRCEAEVHRMWNMASVIDDDIEALDATYSESLAEESAKAEARSANHDSAIRLLKRACNALHSLDTEDSYRLRDEMYEVILNYKYL